MNCRKKNVVLFLHLMFKTLLDLAMGSSDCPNVDTSDGIRTLHHGQKACASLRKTESDTLKGLHYLTCINGNITTSECDLALRLDIETGLCTWPVLAKCQLEDSSTYYSTSSSQRRSANQSQTAKSCTRDNCKLPNCFCYGDVPDMPVSDIPQFVMVTFDDAVSAELYNKYYKPMFVDNVYKVFNPIGCPLRATFFVSNEMERTDYTKVLKLWQAGHEIVSHTIHHELPPGKNDSDYPAMVAEIEGFRQKVLQELGNKNMVDSMKGFRAPYLRVAYNVQYDVLYNYKFLYDSSVTSMEMWFGKNPLWPFTLDYLVGRCINPPCPTKQYPGLWEVIMNAWVADDGHPCSMVDSCLTYNYSTAKQSEWEKIFDQNFEYFYKLKVPMDYFTHGLVFNLSPASYPALGNWLHRLTTKYPDIWVVTPQQVIQWMKNPLTHVAMKNQRWGC